MATFNLSDGVAERLLRRARERGQTVEAFLAEVAAGTPSTSGKGGERPETRLQRFLAMVDRHSKSAINRFPHGHAVDDSRESIYEDRGR